MELYCYKTIKIGIYAMKEIMFNIIEIFNYVYQ